MFPAGGRFISMQQWMKIITVDWESDSRLLRKEKQTLDQPDYECVNRTKLFSCADLHY